MYAVHNSEARIHMTIFIVQGEKKKKNCNDKQHRNRVFAVELGKKM